MAIPAATTTITVKGYGDADDSDPYERSAVLSTKATGVRAVIEPMPGSTSVQAAGEQVVNRLRLICDPCAIGFQDVVVDDLSGRQYRVVFIHPVPDPVRGGYSTGHVEGVLDLVEGLV